MHENEETCENVFCSGGGGINPFAAGSPVPIDTTVSSELKLYLRFAINTLRSFFFFKFIPSRSEHGLTLVGSSEYSAHMCSELGNHIS